MSTLRKTTLHIPCSDPGEESSLPSLWATAADCFRPGEEFELSVDDGLFAWYGEHPGSFPYRMQDNYDRSAAPRDVPAVVLENEFLKATFIPSLGAKLWSLFDKTEGRELLFANDIIRPCNLAMRNAWTSGGIEWNFGCRGHHPYTCSQVCTAAAALPDGTPVLRFYWFERIRRCVVQMDCFLPDGRETLFVRTRITNPNKEVTPVYWWTNIAVREAPGSRVVVPADSYFNAEGAAIKKIRLVFEEGKDETYPETGIIAKDMFYDVKNGGRYIAEIGKDGCGFFETSTSRLAGRKLFIWGNSVGGRRWKNYLSSDGSPGSYNEIQCGLARTQYECVPMPPHTVWEWVEAFGAVRAAPEKIFGDYDEANREISSLISSKISAEELEKILSETRETAVSPAPEIIARGDGFGALELMLRRSRGVTSELMNPHLDFGDTGEAQSAFTGLLENGTVGKHSPLEAPQSYVCQPEWTELLRKAVRGKDRSNWYAHYLLGTVYHYLGDFSAARRQYLRSAGLEKSPFALYCLALIAARKRNSRDMLAYIREAREMLPDDVSIARSFALMLLWTRHYEELARAYEGFPPGIRANARIKVTAATALARLKRTEEAEALIRNGDGSYILVPDIREGEEIFTELWFTIKEQQGVPRGEAVPPPEIDFRMKARRGEL